MFTVKVEEKEYNRIISGKQTYLFMLDENVDIFEGDHILFKKKPLLFEGVLAKIIEKRNFSTFNDMATCLSLDNLGFEGCTNTDVVEYCYKIFDKEKEEKFGVVVFKYELTK